MIYSVLFFLSGFAGLLYQIVWLRLAFSHFGIITPILSVVVSVFMLGLGLGSWIAGTWSGESSARKPVAWLRWYAGIELCVGIWSSMVPHLFRWAETFLLRMGAMNSWTYLGLSALTLSLAILPSCVLMGMTYPVMMAHWRQRSLEAETSFSYLYRANVLGALAGAFFTPFVLIELLGFRCTNLLGVAINGLIAMLSFWASIRLQVVPHLPAPPSPSRDTPTLSNGRLLTALFVTGFVSMAFEVLWTRTFTAILGTTIYAFATVVVVYLASTWGGTCLYRADLRRKTPRSLPTLYGALFLAAFLPVFLNDPRLSFGAAGVVISLAPFCGLLGYLTSLLLDTYSRGVSTKAGRAYAVNVAGCVLGPIAASYLILPTMGARCGILMLSFPLLLLAFSKKAHEKPTSQLFGFLSAGIACAFLGYFVVESSEERAPDYTGPPVIRRDYVATIVSSGKGFDCRLLVNGIGITRLTPLTKMMVHLPLLAHHDRAKSALMICFGMGTTYRSLLSWDLRVTAVELVPSVRDAFGYYFADAQQVIQNARGRIVIDDGRRFLQRTTERYDIVTLDPPPPVEAAGSGLLYTQEFYALVKQKLQPGGVLQQWWPMGEERILRAVAQTLHQSFPFLRVYKGWGDEGFHFVASESPLNDIDFREALKTMPEGARQDALEWHHVPPGSRENPFFDHEIPIERLLGAGDAPILTDDRPINEYYLLRRWRDRQQGTHVFAH